MSSNARINIRPLYLQVRDVLVDRILAGEWKPGIPTPTEHQLAAELNVSLGTVRRALKQMEDEFVINRQQGRGTFVNDQNTAQLALRFSNLYDLSDRQIEGDIIATETETGFPSAEEAKLLGIESSDSVIRVRRVRSHLSRKFAVEACVLPSSLFPSLPSDVGYYRIGALTQQNKLLISGGEEYVEAQMASEAIAGVLEIPKGEVVLTLNRFLRCTTGRVVEWRSASWHAQNIRYRSPV